MIDISQGMQEKDLHNTFKFKCIKGCSLCCSMNDIALYPFDIMNLCNHLSISSSEFHKNYSRYFFDNESGVLRCYLKTDPKCVFFDCHDACKVYDKRPIRCRLFPVARMFNQDGCVQHYLVKEKCSGFESKQKHTIKSWLEDSGVEDYDNLVKQWNDYIIRLKNSNLPLDDEFFIMFFSKIFYDFDNGLHKAAGLKDEPEVMDIRARMEQRYKLARVFLDHIDKWKQGYNEFFSD